MQHPPHPQQRTASPGFSLVELSLVLIVIGLLIGAILVGADLIRASEIRTIATDFDKYNSAVNTFRLKFGKLPGDFPGTAALWGAAAGNATDNYTSTCYATASSAPLGSIVTCNGDGNDLIGSDSSCWHAALFTTVGCSPSYNEQYLVWQHLANAELLAGVFNPARGGHGSLTFRPQWVRGSAGANQPSSQFNRTEGFMLMFLCSTAAYSGVCDHTFIFGAMSPIQHNNFTDIPWYPALTPAEAQSLDGKVDDGKAGTGNVTSTLRGIGLSSNCATTTVASTARYDTSLTDKQCALVFKGNF